MRRSGSVVNSVHKREPAQYRNFGISQTETFTSDVHIYCKYFGTQDRMSCSMDTAKSQGFRARGCSLAF